MLGQVLLCLAVTIEGVAKWRNISGCRNGSTQTNTLFETAVERAQAGELDRAEGLLKETFVWRLDIAPALQRSGDSPAESRKPQRCARNVSAGADFESAQFRNLFQHGHRVLPVWKTVRGRGNDRTCTGSRRGGSAILRVVGRDLFEDELKAEAESRAAEQAAELKSRPGYRPPDPYVARKCDVVTTRNRKGNLWATCEPVRLQISRLPRVPCS